MEKEDKEKNNLFLWKELTSRLLRKMAKKFSNQTLSNNNGKFYCLEMFPYPLAKYTWARKKLYYW